MVIISSKEEDYYCFQCEFKTSGLFDEMGNRICLVCKTKLWICPHCGNRGSSIQNETLIKSVLLVRIF
jgi:hypothetical protein